jgi:hypothetical protein
MKVCMTGISHLMMKDDKTKQASLHHVDVASAHHVLGTSGDRRA